MNAGEVIARTYRGEAVIAEGGMGRVVAAVHEHLGQRVAIKTLLPRTLEKPEATARFLREARAAARLQSEHVGRVLDVGTLVLRGNTLAIGAVLEDSASLGTDGDPANNGSDDAGCVFVYDAGCVFVFVRQGDGSWVQGGYVKTSNSDVDDRVGDALVDGALAVGALNEDSAGTGVNGADNGNTAANSGAVYLFE